MASTDCKQQTDSLPEIGALPLSLINGFILNLRMDQKEEGKKKNIGAIIFNLPAGWSSRRSGLESIHIF